MNEPATPPADDGSAPLDDAIERADLTGIRDVLPALFDGLADAELPPIWAREAGVRGVCMNLMINAVQAMGDGAASSR